MARSGHVAGAQRTCHRQVRPWVCNRCSEVLSEEEVTLLAAISEAGGRVIDLDEAAARTGLPRGLAALGLELLDSRGLI